jgi:hypothetical protein
VQLPGSNLTIVAARNGQVNSIDSQSTRKFVHSKKETGSFVRRFEFYRKDDDLHLFTEEGTVSGNTVLETKPDEMTSMDATILRRDKESTVLTVAIKRSGDLVFEARTLQNK